VPAPPQAETADPKTDAGATLESPIEASNPIILLLSFLWNLAALLLVDLRSLLHALYDIYQTDAGAIESHYDEEYVSGMPNRSASFTISNDDLGDEEFESEEPIKMAGGKVNKNHWKLAPATPNMAEIDIPNQYNHALIENCLVAPQGAQTTLLNVITEGIVDAAFNCLYGLVFAYSIFFEPNIQLHLDLDNICQKLLEYLFTYSDLLDKFMDREAEDAPLPSDGEIDEKENTSPPNPVDFHPKTFSEALKLYNTHGFYSHFRRHPEL
jgi:hypothetical protein